MKKVSIIVPVYNAKDTLIPCVGNIINQTLQDIDIILINDCSTDNSLLIMQLLKERFPDKITIIDSPVNLGAGGARNLGLEIASGEYIGFVDSDDIIDTTMYEKLYNKAIETDCDIVDCGFYFEEQDLSIIYTSDELTGTLDSQKRNELIASGGYIVTKLFKSSYIKNHDFVFRNNVILEDSEIIAYVFATAQSIANVKEVLYIYKNYSNSSSKTVDPHKYFNNCYEAMNAIYKKLSPLNNYSELKESIEYEILQMYSYAINVSLSYGANTPDFDVLEHLKKLQTFRNNFISKGYNNKYVKNKISKADLEIMTLNDNSPEKLINRV